VENPIHVMTQNGVPSEVMDAFFEGRVIADDVGCLRLEDAGGPTVVWPANYTGEVTTEGVTILDGDGNEVGQVDGSFSFGGGNIPELLGTLGFTQDDRDLAEALCPGPIPTCPRPRCVSAETPPPAGIPTPTNRFPAPRARARPHHGRGRNPPPGALPLLVAGVGLEVALPDSGIGGCLPPSVPRKVLTTGQEGTSGSPRRGRPATRREGFLYTLS
jgi:hypothetical protein